MLPSLEHACDTSYATDNTFVGDFIISWKRGCLIGLRYWSIESSRSIFFRSDTYYVRTENIYADQSLLFKLDELGRKRNFKTFLEF